MASSEELAKKLSTKYPSINFKKGFDYFLLNLEFYEKYLKKFYDRYSIVASEIDCALKTEDLSFLTKTVHTIKGSAGYLGADTLFLLSTDLENSFLKNHQTEIKEKMELFLFELKSLLNSIDKILTTESLKL